MSNSKCPRFGLLFAESVRTRAIVDRLAHERMLPAAALEVCPPGDRSIARHRRKVLLRRLGLFNTAVKIRDCLKYRSYERARRYRYNILRTSASDIVRREGMTHTNLAAHGVNSARVREYLVASDIPYWIVSDAGIVRKPLLDAGKKLINCHKGYLPSVRGLSSTHWAILTGLPYGATAHLMDEGLDTGPIIVRRQYPVPAVSSKIELVLEESYMIGDIAFQAARTLSEDLELIPNDGGKYFHSIHPVLAEVSFGFQIKNRSCAPLAAQE